MYQTNAQSLTLDRILGKSKQNKAVTKYVPKHVPKDKQRASSVLSNLVKPCPLPKVLNL